MHPFTPLRARQVIELLDRCAQEVRGLAAVAADPDASHDGRFAGACWWVEAAVQALTTPEATRSEIDAPVAAPHPSSDELALAHLHGLEQAVKALAVPLRGPVAPA